MNPWGILGAVLLAIGLAGGGYYEGWSQRGDHEAALQLVAERAAADDLKKERERGDALAVQLDIERGAIHEATITQIKEIPAVTTTYQEAPDAPVQNIPPAVYTVGFVRLWNDSLYTSLPKPTGQPFGAAESTDTLRAKIDSPDVLANAVENFGKYAACRAQLNKLIDFELGRGSAPQQPVQ